MEQNKNERTWTDEQLSAINTRDKSLLVSAAAGSGKTATLTERIIRSILDKDDPIDINRILVVTFTKAAAGELRDRISSAITAALADEPDNKRLEKQLLLLPSAKIMTIDAFCNDCVRSYPDAAGINPGYRIADEAEIMLAAKDIFEGIVESIMRNEVDVVSPEELDALTDCLVDTKRMADVFDVFRRVHTSLRATKDGAESFLSMAKAYDPSEFVSPDKTVFGKYIMNYEQEQMQYRATLSERLADDLEYEGEYGARYAECARADKEVYTRVAKIKDYSAMKASLEELRLPTLPRGIKAESKTPLMVLYQESRNKEKERTATERQKFFSYTPEEWRDAYEKLYPLMMTFYRVLMLFDRALDAHKRRHGCFDYTDIERLAYAALVKDGEPTETAKAMREEFLAVYIDEYQDVNDLQDSIFEAICRPDNKFCVGDIKQSIYAFRSANPEIFARAKRALPPLDLAKDEPAASVFMSTNFRSSEGVIGFVNDVFDRMFGAFASGIDYRHEDRLNPGRQPKGESFSKRPEICLLPKLDVSYNIAEDEIDDGEDQEPVTPAVVAAKIREILDTGRREDGSAVRPGDIAVVLRSMKGRSEKYVAALERLGIPTRTSGKKSFFLNSDVLLALCLFNTIYNPLRDVYLTGLLRSPIFEFSADELVLIRKEKKGVPFYRALVAFTESHPEFKKGKMFLEKLAAWREVSEGMRTDRLIRNLFRETGLLALAAEHGEKENLIRLYEYARSFEGSSFSGLGGFISYINSIIAEGERFDMNIESTATDAVTVISAHSSKGLEYPIVFLAEAHRRIQSPEIKEKLLFSHGFGAGLRHRTPLGLAIVDNPMINAVAEKIKTSGFEEELRILYVALTRAKEQLYIVGSYGEVTVDEYLAKTHLLSYALSRASAKRLTSHLDVILAATNEKPTPPTEFVSGAKEIINVISKIETNKLIKEIAGKADEDGKRHESELIENIKPEHKNQPAPRVIKELKDELVRRFTYEYHSPYLSDLPEKLSVSELYPTVLDGTENDSYVEGERIFSQKSSHTYPEFIAPSKEAESKRRGIATHVFMQFCDLELLKSTSAEAELKRLKGLGYFSDREAKRVRLEEIEAFSRSELFDRMLAAKRIWRELRFNTVLPADAFTDVPERKQAVEGRGILVQGVIDCILENPDGSFSVIDYKTDRLSRAELLDRSLAEERLRESHKTQLGYYAKAAKELFGKEPTTVEVYSLHLGACVNILGDS